MESNEQNKQRRNRDRERTHGELSEGAAGGGLERSGAQQHMGGCRDATAA